MAQDERNFRSAYYEKVGFKSVEEKKSLEILLKEKNLDRGKLKQFCLRFSVPSVYRNLVWKVLLDIIPTQVECHSFVMDQKRQECMQMTHALYKMRILELGTPKPQLFFAMWLLQMGKLHFDVNVQVENGFTLIARTLQQFFDDDIDLYFLTKGFYTYIQKFVPDIPKLIDVTLALLDKEDGALYGHLNKTEILKSLPMDRWFDTCFAEVLRENALARIWDKLFGGSNKILVYVVVVMLTNQRHKLFKCNNADSAMQCINNLPQETTEIIVNKAIEMWQIHGSALTVHDKPKP